MKKVLKVRTKEDGTVVFDNIAEAIVFMEELDLLPKNTITLDEVTEEFFNNMKEFEQ